MEQIEFVHTQNYIYFLVCMVLKNQNRLIIDVNNFKQNKLYLFVNSNSCKLYVELSNCTFIIN